MVKNILFICFPLIVHTFKVLRYCSIMNFKNLDFYNVSSLAKNVSFIEFCKFITHYGTLHNVPNFKNFEVDYSK